MKKKLTSYFILAAMLVVFLFAPRPPGVRTGYFPLFCFAIFDYFNYNSKSTFQIAMKKIILVLAVYLSIGFILNLKLKPAHAYVYYGPGGRAWYPTRSFIGNYYGSGGLWGSYGGGYLYGPGNYGGWWWKSPTGRWWVNPR